MKTILMTISRGSLVRNFFYTGIVSRLLAYGFRVVVVTPYVGHQAFKRFGNENLLFEQFPGGKRPLNALFTELFKAAVFGKTVRIRFKYRVTGREPSRALYYLRLMCLSPMRLIPGFKRLLRSLEVRNYPEHGFDFLFEKYKPDLVFSTASGNDSGLIKGAKRFRVLSVDMPKSWDNLSKSLTPVKADRLFVWSPFMKNQALHFQGYRSDEVVVTGIPQLDFYCDKKRLIQREVFCERFGLDPKKKIILYGSTGGNCVDENPYLELLSGFIDTGEIKNAQVLVRPHIGHPKDEERFRTAAAFPHVVLDRTGRQDDSFKDRWDVSEENINHLFNSLYHASVVVNVASTLTLDAVACGTEVININFDVHKTSPHWSARRLYGSDYIDAILKTGASWVVRSRQEFLQAFRAVLERGGTKEGGRQKLIEFLMYKNDGKSSERLARSLLALIS